MRVLTERIVDARVVRLCGEIDRAAECAASIESARVLIKILAGE